MPLAKSTEPKAAEGTPKRLVAFEPQAFRRVPPGPDVVKRLRKSAKAARALLRLAEDTGDQRAAFLRRRIGSWARHLSPIRDAAVIPKIAAKLTQDKSDRSAHAGRVVESSAPPKKNLSWWRNRQGEWSHLSGAVADFPIASLSRSAVLHALRHSLKRVRKAAKRVDSKDAELAHQWRKRLVLLRAQVRIMSGLLDGSARILDQRLSDLTHQLGRAVDCKVLLASLANRRRHRTLTGKAAEALAKAARKKQTKAIRKARKTWRHKRRLIFKALP